MDRKKAADLAYAEGYRLGADSRDAEIQRLQFALADSEALELGTAERCDQLRAHINMLREALACGVRVVESYIINYGHSQILAGLRNSHRKLLSATTQEQSLAEYRNKVIEDCAKRAEAYTYMSQNFNALAEELRAMKEPE